MFYSPKLFLKDKWIAPPFFVSVLAQFFIWWHVIRNIKPGAEQIFLHYNIVFGVDLLGPWWKIYYLPVGGLLIFLVNYLLALRFYGEDRMLARLLSLLAALLEVFLVIAVYYIVGLNI